ncbi:hypothetical protein AVEN_43017-1 [Araneus ventricosus]|uniref:Uncharacterized protein n=1 Tax=Araneus ventricosus TaxID=182803 RepID=A0A4Y2VPA9_ARAVE|nr:hypothetical protein AVEN_43017-1 [Araneus ventricosus]
MSKCVPLKSGRIDGSFRKKGRRTFLFVPQVNINRASFKSRTNQFITGPGPFVTCLHRFGLCSHDRCVCGAKGDRNHYVTVCPVTKRFHSRSPVLKIFRRGVKILSKTKDPWHDSCVL